MPQYLVSFLKCRLTRTLTTQPAVDHKVFLQHNNSSAVRPLHRISNRIRMARLPTYLGSHLQSPRLLEDWPRWHKHQITTMIMYRKWRSLVQQVFVLKICFIGMRCSKYIFKGLLHHHLIDGGCLLEAIRILNSLTKRIRKRDSLRTHRHQKQADNVHISQNKSICDSCKQFPRMKTHQKLMPT